MVYCIREWVGILLFTCCGNRVGYWVSFFLLLLYYTAALLDVLYCRLPFTCDSTIYISIERDTHKSYCNTTAGGRKRMNQLLKTDKCLTFAFKEFIEKERIKISIKDHHANGIRLDKEDFIHNNSFPICRNVLRQQTGITHISRYQTCSNVIIEQNKIENVIFQKIFYIFNFNEYRKSL